MNASSWVDPTVLHAVLSGLLILVLAWWAWVAWVRLQQDALFDRVLPALEAAQDRGLALRPLGIRTRLVARGQVQGRPLRLEWRTGVLGPRCLLVDGGTRRPLPLLCSAEDLARALDPADA